MTPTAAETKAAKFEEERERRSLAQVLRDAGTQPPPNQHLNLFSEDEITAALDGGLTRDDVEWNQRLARPWTYKATDADAEQEARLSHYG